MNNKTHDFLIWSQLNDERLASFGQRPENIRRKAYLLNEGLRCVDWFPKVVDFVMDEDRGMMLADVLPNHAIFQIVSEKIKEILESEVPEEVEFLPIQVLDHRKNKVECRYYIANVLTVVSCVDHKKSVYEMSALDKTQVHHFEHLILDEDKIHENTKIFRLEEERTLILLRGDLFKRIVDSGCTGMSSMVVQDYGQQYRPIDRVELAKKLLKNG